MATRTDYYVGTGKEAEWLGSTPYDYGTTLVGLSEEGYRAAVTEILKKRGTSPEQGWPWPWNDSATSDFAYCWTLSGVRKARFGRGWFTAGTDEEGMRDEHGEPLGTLQEWPDMSAIQNVAWDERSGVMILGLL